MRTTRLDSVLSTDVDYNPREHRRPSKPIQVWMAYLNILRIGLGAGVVGVPMAISQVGTILGPLLGIFTGFLIIHTHLMLLNCLNEVSTHLRIPYISYRYGFRIALLHGPAIFNCIGNRGPIIITACMLMSQLGICTVFVIFTSDSLRDIMDFPDSKPALLCLLIPYLILEFAMKDLKIISYISMLGNFLNVIGMMLVIYYIVQDVNGETIYFTTDALPLLVAFGTFLFNWSAVGVILSLDKCLANPLVMTGPYGAINIGILVPTIIAVIFGTMGYCSYGTLEDNILRSLPYDENGTMASAGLYLIAIAFAYPIQCYPAIQILMEVIKTYNPYDEISAHTMNILQYMARPLFVLASFTISYFVPFQGPFVAFIGNMCTTMLALVFPAMMEISMMYPGPYGKHNVYLVKNIMIIIIGFLSWFFGVILCGNLIYVRVLSLFSSKDVDYL